MPTLTDVRERVSEFRLSPRCLRPMMPTESSANHRYLLLKRAMDLALSSMLLMLLFPLLLVTAVLIRLDSPGPAIFKQTRVGKQGKPFTFLKFRSMREDADPSVHRAHMRRLIRGADIYSVGLDDHRCGERAGKLHGDGRVTRVGKLIRKTSVDELPQLVNVMRGEMSLVGPRPPLPYEVETYEDWHLRRLEVAPGITSLWAVSGRADIPFDDQARMDILYIDNRSLWMDAKILMQTPWAVISGRGAG